MVHLQPDTVNHLMPLPEFALDKLEFDKLKDVLSGYLSTPAGAERIQQIKPATNRSLLQRQLAETADMLHLIDASQSPPLQTLYDVSPALAKSKIERYVLDGISIFRIGKWAESARLLRAFFANHAETAAGLWDVAQELVPVKTLETEITRIVDEKGDIKSNASPELSRITRRINVQKQSARSVLQQILQKSREAGMTSDEEATMRGGRMVIPVKSEYKRKIRGFIHDSSATGQTVYIEPVEVFEKNNEIRELLSEWQREADRLLRELSAQIGQNSDQLTQNSFIIGHIDACYAAARLGMRWNGIIPKISDNGSVSLLDCRNPLLLLKFNSFEEGKRHIVPLNLDMSPDEQGIIITGPNAGGKSVTLKTFGLAVVLTQCGIPIPAQEGAQLPVINGLYIDMGDEQSIDNDLSTFSSRLTWMRDVMAQTERDIWVLIDEAGSGTDPDEGTALFQAFFEFLSDQGIRSIVTTHHGALKTFAHEKEGWCNASMEFDQKSLSPTYRFQKGIPGSSYAFEIADRITVPAALTKRARELVGSGKNKLESLIMSLEQDSQQLMKEKNELERQRDSWNRSKEELDKRLSHIREERDRVRDNAMEEAETLLRDANRKIEEAIRAAAEQDKEQLKVKRKDVEELTSQVQARQSRQSRKKKRKLASPSQNATPKAGDAVRLMDSGTIGELAEITGKKATVIVNGLRVKTRFDNLERTDRTSTGKPARGYKLTSAGDDSTVRPFSQSLDLRGNRGNEAVQKVTLYVDEGITRGLERLSIIHGRGDGILRKLVHEHLQSRRDVKHFETAPIEDGGDGCTYVYL